MVSNAAGDNDNDVEEVPQNNEGATIDITASDEDDVCIYICMIHGPHTK